MTDSYPRASFAPHASVARRMSRGAFRSSAPHVGDGDTLTPDPAPASGRGGARGGKDVAFAVGIVLILCLFFLPAPAVMTDFGLASPIDLSVSPCK